MNYMDMLHNHARNRPTHPAIMDPQGSVNYRDLDLLITAAAARFLDHGVRQGDFVGVMLPDQIEHLVVICGLIRMGAIVLSLDPSAPLPEIASTANRFGMRHVAATTDVLVPGIATVRVDDDWRVPPSAGLSGLEFPDRDDMPALVLMSSGTTGVPKAILSTHGQLRQRLPISQMSMSYGPADRYASIVPICFNVGRIHSLQTLQTAGTVVIFPSLMHAQPVPDLINRNHISWTFVTPHHLRQLIKLAPGNQPMMPNLRQLVVGSSVLHAEERVAARKVVSPRLVEQYGSNECGLHTMSTAVDQMFRPDSVGRIIVGIDGEVVDEAERPVPAGTMGLIRFRGPGFPTAYWNDPEATAQTFKNGWFYPGDMAVIDADGFVFLMGRADDMINFDGTNVSPQEVEGVLQKHPAVAEAAVVGYVDPERRELPVAFIVMRQEVTLAQLHEYSQASLSVSKQPRAYIFVESLPKNDMGKLLRRELRQKAADFLNK